MEDTVEKLLDGMEQLASAEYNWLRDAQKDVFEKARQHLESGESCGTFDLLTGAGKTVLFGSLIKSKILGTLPELDPENKRLPITPDMLKDKELPGTLILCPTQQLVDQTLGSLAKFLPEYVPLKDGNDPSTMDEIKLDDIDFDKSIIGGLYNGFDQSNKPIVVTTYQSLVADMRHAEQTGEPRKFSEQNFDLVFGDEAHKGLGKETKRALDCFTDKAVRFAMSATTKYSKERTVQGYWGGNIAEIGVLQGQDLGLIVPWFKTILVETGIEVKTTEGDFHGAENYSSSYYRKLNNQTRNLCAVSKYMNFADPQTNERLFGQTGIVTCGSHAHAEDFAEAAKKTILNNPDYAEWLKEEAKVRAQACKDPVLKERFLKEGIALCEVITSDTPRNERRRILSDHKSGKTLLLSGVRIPAEGYDNPRASFIFCLAPTLSLVKKKQEGGRVLRLDPNNPDKIPYIFEFVDKEQYKAVAGSLRAPILYPETLGPDFKHRTPPPSIGNRHRGGHEPPPPIDLSIDIGDVISDISQVHQFISDRIDARVAATQPFALPPEYEGWVSVRDMLESYGLPTSQQNLERVNGLLDKFVREGERFTAENDPSPKPSWHVISNQVFRIGNTRIPTYLVHPDYQHCIMDEVIRQVGYNQLLPGMTYPPIPAKHKGVYWGDWEVDPKFYSSIAVPGISGDITPQMFGAKLRSIMQAPFSEFKDDIQELPVRQADGTVKHIPLKNLLVGPYQYHKRQGGTHLMHGDIATHMIIRSLLKNNMSYLHSKDAAKQAFDPAPGLASNALPESQEAAKELDAFLSHELSRAPNQHIPVLEANGVRLSDKPLHELVVADNQYMHEGFFLTPQAADWAIRSINKIPSITLSQPHRESYLSGEDFLKKYRTNIGDLDKVIEQKLKDDRSLPQYIPRHVNGMYRGTNGKNIYLIHTSAAAGIARELSAPARLPLDKYTKIWSSEIPSAIGLASTSFNRSTIEQLLRGIAEENPNHQVVSGPYVTDVASGPIYVLNFLKNDDGDIGSYLRGIRGFPRNLLPANCKKWTPISDLGPRDEVIAAVKGFVAEGTLKGYHLDNHVRGPFLTEKGSLEYVSPDAVHMFMLKQRGYHGVVASNIASWTAVGNALREIAPYGWTDASLKYVASDLADLASNHPDIRVPVLKNYHAPINSRDLYNFKDRETEDVPLNRLIYVPENAGNHPDKIKVDPRIVGMLAAMTGKAVPPKFANLLPELDRSSPRWIGRAALAKQLDIKDDELQTLLETGIAEQDRFDSQGKQVPLCSACTVLRSGFSSEVMVDMAAIEYFKAAINKPRIPTEVHDATAAEIDPEEKRRQV